MGEKHVRLGGIALHSGVLVRRPTSKVPAAHRGVARPLGTTASIGVSVELFGWMTRNPAHPVALVRSPRGFELQKPLSTSEPSQDQVEVADAARDACLALEHERQLS